MHYDERERFLDNEGLTSGNKAANRIDVEYRISKKDSRTERIPLLKLWRSPSRPKSKYSFSDSVSSIAKAKDYIREHFGNFELVRQRHRKSGDIFTFRFVPHPDSEAGRNPGMYPENYTHLRIKTEIHYPFSGDPNNLTKDQKEEFARFKKRYG